MYWSNEISGEVGQSIIDFRFESVMNFTTYFIDALQIVAQTYLVIVVSSKQFQNNEECFRSLTVSRVTMLKTTVRVLEAGNFFYWLNGSVVEFTLIQKAFVGNTVFGTDVWVALSQFTLPIALYFRLACALNLIEFDKNNLRHWKPKSN